VAADDAMLKHLTELIDASDSALTQEAAHYAHADLRTEARIDASYPAVPRPPVTTD
jgi:hypothetical protein